MRTELYKVYSGYDGVKMTDFGGWELPVNFSSGIIAEHNAVRHSAGIFDVSHMGECMVKGSGAREFLDYMVTNDVGSQPAGKALYTIMCYDNGTCVDDLIIYCLSDDEFFVVMNASNVEKDLEWLSSHAKEFNAKDPSKRAVEINDCSANISQLAVQGPDAVRYVEKCVPHASELGFFCFETADIFGLDCIVGRTGYTGEDGFEIYIPNSGAALLWNFFISEGVMPCGLGARDTLRMEAKLPLYGHEISSTITPLEANLGLFVKLGKPSDFIGKAALVKQKEEGVPRSLRGFEIEGGVARNGYPVFLDGEEIGYVTSGAKSPSTGKFVGYALVKRDTGLKFGDSIDIEVHGKLKKAVLCKTPFYKTTAKTA